MKKVDSGVKFCYTVCNKRSIKVVNIDRRETKEGLMKKINVKATIFLSAIVLVVVVLLLNLIEFRRTVDFTVPGIRMPKENAYGKQEEGLAGSEPRMPRLPLRFMKRCRTWEKG